MQEIVQDALRHAEEPEAEHVRLPSQDIEEDSGYPFGDPRIVVIGIGGAGNNCITRLHSVGIEDADTIAINTDKQHLELIEADTKILVGKDLTQGLGAGGDPSVGQRASEMAQGTIKEVIGDADLVFVTAGMGGGTGTGGAPVVSDIAKDQGAIVVSMVSTPFNVERARTVKAEEGLERLRETSDSTIVLDNNRLLDYVPNLPLGKAFSVMDQIIAETIIGISETVTQPSLINLDYADISTILEQSGIGVMLVGETQDKNRTDEVVNDALNHPLLDVDYRGASGSLLHITGGPDLTLKQAEGIANKMTENLNEGANVIWGARIKEEYKGKVRVMALMTGVQSVDVLGPTTQKQADRSRDAIEDSDLDPNIEPEGGEQAAVSDGGEKQIDTRFGIDVIR